MNVRSDVIAAAMQQALYAATHSPDPSTQNGAVIIDSDATIQVFTADCNRFPAGVENTPERWERPAKYRFVDHAERTAIHNASRHGVCTSGAALVAVWASCSDCAKAIVGAGVRYLVRFPLHQDGIAHWADDIAVGETILREGGVEVIEDDFTNLSIPPLLRNGEIWRP